MITLYQVHCPDLNNYSTTADLNSTTALFAPLVNPTFTGTITFPDSTSISSTISSYVTASNLNNILTYNYAPLSNPTLTGNINLNGNVTLAQTSANTLTLNDHFVANRWQSTVTAHNSRYSVLDYLFDN